MDRPPNSAEEVAESVNPGDQGLPALDPFEFVRSESHDPAEQNDLAEDISGHSSGIRKINSSESSDRYRKKT